MGGWYATRRIILALGTEYAATRMSLMALMDCVHSDGANPPGRNFSLLTGALQCALRLCKSILRCSSKHLQLWRCIQDATRLTIRIVKCCSSGELCTGLPETSRAAETSAQVCWRLLEQLRLLLKLCGRLGAIFPQQWFRAAVVVGSISILFFFHFCSVRYMIQHSIVGGDEVKPGGSSAIWPARPEAEGVVRSCHTQVRVNTVWINNNNNSSRS